MGKQKYFLFWPKTAFCSIEIINIISKGITKGETFSGNDLTSLKKVEHVEESKEDSCEGVVTTDMLKEEENLENEGRKEEGKFKEEQQKVN